MRPHQLHLALHGLTLRVTSDDPTVHDWLAGFLGYLGLDPAPPDGGPPDLQLELRCAPPAHAGAAGLRPVEGTGLVTTTLDSEVVVRSDGAELRLQPARGRASGSVAPELVAAGRLNPNLVAYTLLTLLRHRDLYPLHAAALARDGQGLLVVADSGGGKSTVALRLARRGWGLVSDDSVLLAPTGEGVVARRLRRDLFVTAGGRDGDDDARGLDRLEPRKRRIDARRELDAPLVAAAAPGAVVFPELVDAADSRLEPCPPDGALHLLSHHSLVAELEPSRAHRHMEVLAALVAQSSSWRLAAGRDLRDDPDAAHRLLRPLVG